METNKPSDGIETRKRASNSNDKYLGQRHQREPWCLLIVSFLDQDFGSGRDFGKCFRDFAAGGDT